MIIVVSSGTRHIYYTVRLIVIYLYDTRTNIVYYTLFFLKKHDQRVIDLEKPKVPVFIRNAILFVFFFLFEHVITNKVGCTYVEKQRLLSLENGLVSMTKVRVYLWCCVYDKLIKRHLKWNLDYTYIYYDYVRINVEHTKTSTAGI